MQTGLDVGLSRTVTGQILFPAPAQLLVHRELNSGEWSGEWSGNGSVLVEALWLGGLSETARAALGAISVAARLRDLRGVAYRGLWVVGEEWFGTRAGFGGYLGFFTAQYLRGRWYYG